MDSDEDIKFIFEDKPPDWCNPKFDKKFPPTKTKTRVKTLLNEGVKEKDMI